MTDMTDAQRLKKLNDLEAAYKLTERGYSPNGVHWRTVDRLVNELQLDAHPDIPNLGPIVADGVSILKQDCTHLTSALKWPAFDDGFRIGRAVIAPEDCEVDDDTSDSQGGDAFYIKGVSTIRYWVAHITVVPKLHTKFKKGQVMTKISSDHPRPHVHLAIDTRPLIGHHLISHDDYTHGAPLIGVQLNKALNT